MVSSTPEESQFFFSNSFWRDLSRRLPRSHFKGLFGKASLSFIEGEQGLETLVVLVSSESVKSTIEKDFQPEVLNCAKSTISPDLEVRFQVAEEEDSLQSTEEYLLQTDLPGGLARRDGIEGLESNRFKAGSDPSSGVLENGSPSQQSPPSRFQEISSPLIPEHTFDRFVVGGANRIAQAMILAAVEEFQNTGATSTQLTVLISPPGLGKTHLLHSAGNYIQKNTSFRVLFLNGEELYENMGGSLPREEFTSQSQALRKKLRYYDAFLIDGIHFLRRGEHVQEAFNAILEDFTSKEKLVLLTSDTHPRAISKITQRTLSRLGQGVIQEIQLPDPGLSLDFLSREAETLGIDPPTFLLEALISGSKPDFRQLRSLLQAVAEAAKAEEASTGTAAATTSDSELDPSTSPRSSEESPELHPESFVIETHDIIKNVAHFYGKRITDIKSERREKSLVRARQVAMYLCRKYSQRSYEEIGGLFGKRNHATVIYAVKKIRGLRKTDSILNNEVQVIMKRMNLLP